MAITLTLVKTFDTPEAASHWLALTQPPPVQPPPPPVVRTCNVCNQEKGEDCFYLQKKGSSQRMRRCKQCDHAYKKAKYSRAHPPEPPPSPTWPSERVA
jgi:hypothetical protein